MVPHSIEIIQIVCNNDIVVSFCYESMPTYVSKSQCIQWFVYTKDIPPLNELIRQGKHNRSGSLKIELLITNAIINERFYKKQESPLQKTFEGYQDFFNLFENFRGYVDFFFLQDLVSDDYSSIKPLLPCDGLFPLRPFPKNLDQYYIFIKNTISFTKNRTDRMLLNYNVTNVDSK